MATWENSCERYFPETEEITKKGTKKRLMVEVRKMHIMGNFLFTDQFEVNYLKRGGEFKFYVKQVQRPVKEKWNTLKLNIQAPVDKCSKEGTYTREQFKPWLTRLIGIQAEAAIVDLLTMPPQNLAA
jgi:hypothetical protein